MERARERRRSYSASVEEEVGWENATGGGGFVLVVFMCVFVRGWGLGFVVRVDVDVDVRTVPADARGWVVLGSSCCCHCLR